MSTIVQKKSKKRELKPKDSFASRARAHSKHGSRSSQVISALGQRAMGTRELLITKAKELFLERGFGGTVIDDIADAASVSRATFYTYFPTKNDILLAAGVEARQSNDRAIRMLSDVPTRWTLEDLKTWIRIYFAHLDNHGGYMLVWSQAAWQEEKMRSIGTKGSLATADFIGGEMSRMGASKETDRRILGLCTNAMLDRFWYIWRKTNAPFQGEQAIDEVAKLLAVLLGRPGG